jgi:hypothetical protein
MKYQGHQGHQGHQGKHENQGHFEHLVDIPRDKKAISYSPKMFQPDIAEQVNDDNFIPLPNMADAPWAVYTGNYGEADILDDGASGNLGFSYNLCSKSCCSAQILPFSLTPDDYVLMSGKEYLPTPYTCNNGWQDSGCMCMTKEQSMNLKTRGAHDGDL